MTALISAIVNFSSWVVSSILGWFRSSLGWFLNGILSGIGSFLSGIVTELSSGVFLALSVKKVIRFLGLTMIIGLFIAFTSFAYSTLMALAAPTLPGWFIQGLTIIFPPNIVPCLITYYSVKAAAWVYLVNVSFIREAIDYGTNA